MLWGKNRGALIGRRGGTVGAIRQLASYAVSRRGSGRVRVRLDAENCREKREQSLEHLARKAKKAASSTTEAGRVGDRPYARGRSYKADRYDDQ